MLDLGVYSLDTATNGKYVSNKNKSLFLGFLKYSGMIYVNGIFAKGVPTYKLAGKRQSIIDVCLASNISSVKSVSVLPYILGVNPQTSHKIIQLPISDVGTPKKSRRKLIQVRKFNYCTYEALVKVKEAVSKRIVELLTLMPGRDIVYQYKKFLPDLLEYEKRYFKVQI